MTDTPTRTRTRTPRFNHVAMSLPGEALDERGRADIVAFCGDVFGWQELPMMTKDRKRLVLSAWTTEQFVFLHGSDEAMTAPPTDHFGLSVQSLAELEEFRDRALAAAGHDPRVDVTAQAVEDYGALKLHSFYVSSMLPLTIEVQHFEYVSDPPS
ncbi:MAG: hypothetical protein M3R01_07165 [Actinomycetota bacterium]|nr:hypothetical protein [Actinomycetota bacterium]